MTRSTLAVVFSAGAVVGLLCSSALAQPRIRVLHLAGDPAPAGPVIGNYTVFDNVLVNNSGDWLIAATTNAFDPNADSVVVKNGAYVRAENDPATPLAGLNIGLPQELALSNSGDVWYQFSLRNATSSTDSAIDLNGNVVIQEGSPAGGFSAGTNFIGFFRVYAGADKQSLMIGSVDDPAITSTVDRGLYRLDGVGPAFTSVTQTLLAKEGDILPGQTAAVTDFATSFHEAAMNSVGTPMFKATISGAGTAMYIGTSLLAQTSTSAAPAFSGRNWSGFGRVDLNTSGACVFTATLDGDAATNTVIAKGSSSSTLTKVVQEGDSITVASGTWLITGFGTGPVKITESGKVVYFADWTDPDTNADSGLFIDNTLLLQEGQILTTPLGPLPIKSLAGSTDSGENITRGFDASDNGKWVFVRLTFEDGITSGGLRGLVLIDVCPTDINGSGIVDADDIFAFLSLWFAAVPGSNCTTPPTGCPGDWNNSGVVDADDIFAFLADWFAFGPGNGC